MKISSLLKVLMQITDSAFYSGSQHTCTTWQACVHSLSEGTNTSPAKYTEVTIQTQSNIMTHTGQQKDEEQREQWHRNRGVGKAGITCPQWTPAHFLCRLTLEMHEGDFQLNMAK